MEEIKREDSIGFQFGMFMRSFRKLMVHRFSQRDMGITLEQFGLLHMLKEDDTAILSDIAQRMGIDKSAVMRFIDTLEDKRLVARINDKNDRRKKIIVLTKKGNEKVQESELFFNEIMNELTLNIKKDEMKLFGNVLNKMRQNAEV